jgi:hypothetical protein
LTRSAEVAASWALVDRDDDEGRGSIFIFDRQSLERRYKIEANPEVWWNSKTTFHDEAEEEIWDSVVDVGNHLIGVVSDPTIQRSPKRRKLISTSRTELKRRRRTEIEARLGMLGVIPPVLIENVRPLAARYQGKKVKVGELLDCGAFSRCNRMK